MDDTKFFPFDHLENTNTKCLSKKKLCKQAGAELCQAQDQLGQAKLGQARL